MREDWIEVTLGEIAEITTGSRAKGGAISSGIPSIGGEQIADDRSIKFDKMKYIPEDHFDRMRTGKLNLGDSLLVKDGATTGKVGYWGFNIQAAVNEHVFILRARPHRAEPYFINLLISQQSFRNEIESRTRGIIGGITRDIENIELNIPLLPEQKRIVDLFSSVDSYIATLEQQAGSARKSRSAVLHELLSAGGEDWIEVTLGEIAEITTGSRAKGGAISSGIPSIGGEQIADDRSIKFDKMKYIPEDHFDRMRTGKLNLGDSLLVKDGATTGKVGYWGFNIQAAVNEHVFILRARPHRAEPYFINLLISQQSFRNEIESRTRGIIGGITRDIENIELNIPLLPEQKRIVDLISSMDDGISTTEKLINETKHLRSGLLSDLLSGKHEIPESYDKVIGAA